MPRKPRSSRVPAWELAVLLCVIALLVFASLIGAGDWLKEMYYGRLP